MKANTASHHHHGGRATGRAMGHKPRGGGGGRRARATAQGGRMVGNRGKPRGGGQGGPGTITRTGGKAQRGPRWTPTAARAANKFSAKSSKGPAIAQASRDRGKMAADDNSTISKASSSIWLVSLLMTPVNLLQNTFFRSEHCIAHSYGPDPHSCAVL